MYARLAAENYYRKFYFQDSFYAQCKDVEPMSLIHFESTVANVKKIIDLPIFEKVDHIIATGCGDSNVCTFSAKEAYAHFLPHVEYEAVDSIELARHYEYEGDYSNTILLCISYSGGIYRTLEAMKQCQKHGITTIGMTTNATSRIANESDIHYNTGIPAGDNNAGNRTYCANVISMMVLAAAIAEKQTGKPCIEELRQGLLAYHKAFFEKIDEIDNTAFKAAIHWMDKKYIEVLGDGPLFWAGKFIQAKVVELSGDPCSVVDSDYYRYVNAHLSPTSEYGTLVLINSNDPTVDSVVTAAKDMLAKGRELLLFSDKTPEELGLSGEIIHCPMPAPAKEHNYLAPIFAYLPGSYFAGFRHTTIGEPMFRGGFDSRIFMPTYFSPIDVINLD